MLHRTEARRRQCLFPVWQRLGCNTAPGGPRMKWTIAIAMLTVAQAAAPAAARPPLNDGATLNIGLNCQWQQRCMARQRSAMERSLEFVRNQRPAEWRI